MKISTLIVIIACLLIAGILFFVFPRPSGLKISPGQPQVIVSQKNAPRSAESSPPPGNQMVSMAERLRASQDKTERQQTLAELRNALAGMPPAEAAKAIRDFLNAKADASTGQSFKVNGHGLLDEAPTLRTYLLDQLAQIDPAAAADYARTILNGSDSPDEWAVALRNLARGDQTPEGRGLLEAKTRELLAREDWQQNPSIGYLEAFDTAVYLGGTNLLPALSALVTRKDNPAVAHAAFLTMDRLVIEQPADVLSALNADPSSMQGREQTRANYFARVDVRDPRQLQVVESYLLNTKISSAELSQFAGLFPNANYMLSQNLLTTSPTGNRADLVARDAQSLQQVNQWLADSRFENLRPQLQKMKTRLETFVAQASSAK